MDGKAEIALPSNGRLAGMDAHADGWTHSVEPWVPRKVPLGRDRGGQSILRRSECDEERVALGIDLSSPVLLERGAQDPGVALEHIAVSVPELVEHASRPL